MNSDERQGLQFRVDQLGSIEDAAVVEAEHTARSGIPVRLSVAMAAHNEAPTIRSAIEQVLAVEGPFELELVVVDDGSTDDTWSIVESFDDPRLVALRHESCRGKGAAIMSASAVATGTHILIFDADLEYSASDIPLLVEPVLCGVASIVYGARIRGSRTVFPSLLYALGSKATTVFANTMFNSWISDMHTCLKLVPLRLFRQLSLSESGFGLDTEMTCEVLRRGMRPFEVPCAYHGRSFAAGKKISTRDGFECLKIVLQVRFRGRIRYTASMLELRAVPADEDVQPMAEPPLRVAELPGPGGSRTSRSHRRRNAMLYAGGGGSKAI